MTRRIVVALLLGVVAAALVLVGWRAMREWTAPGDGAPAVAHPAPPAAASVERPMPPAPPPRGRTRAEIVQGTPPGILHFADELNAPDRTARDDVQLLAAVVQLYRRQTQGLNPVGENFEITAVLTGRNRLGYAFIAPDHPAINAQGELCDRWGTPYFFHQISGTVMQVRSAGPDRKIWTDDDIGAGPEE
jgi:hypothetical protein